jgi:hypothetical protein
VSPSNGGGSEGGGGGSKGFKKRAWQAAEDQTLRQLVETHGPKDWNFISAQLQGRSAKQCCERCVRGCWLFLGGAAGRGFERR